MQREDGGWLFISHAHEDIEQVRKIRNYLEDEGFNPIVFFLKSKTTPWTLNSLIKKEIRARKWFVLVDSPHSRKSRWVQREVEYVNKLKDKITFTVDLSRDIIPQLRKIIRRTRVFVTYSHRDADLVRRISRCLSENDFQVWTYDLHTPGSMWMEEIASELERTRDGGFLLAIITESMLNSEDCRQEISYMIKKHGMVVPVVVGDVKLSPFMEILLADRQYLRIGEQPTPQELDRLVERIARYV